MCVTMRITASARAVREFFRYVLGPDGRRAVSRQKIYLPLPVDFARRELSKLE